jgi:hypothetical protein
VLTFLKNRRIPRVFALKMGNSCTDIKEVHSPPEESIMETRERKKQVKEAERACGETNPGAVDSVEVLQDLKGQPSEESSTKERKRDERYIFDITFNTRPLGIVVKSSSNGTCAYVTDRNVEENRAVENLPIKSKVLRVNGVDVEMLHINEITAIVSNESKMPLKISFCHPDGLSKSEASDPVVSAALK